MGPAGEQFCRLGRAFGILRGHAGDKIAGKILQQSDAAAFRRKRWIARAARLRIAIGQEVGGKIKVRSAEIDMFNPSGDLDLGRWRKRQIVENIARDARVAVRAEQPVEQRAGIIGLGALSS